MRSCNWYCRKELVLEVGRVNEPGNRIWLKMGLNRKPQVKKEVPGFLGFGKGVGSFPLSFPPGLLLSVFLVVSWFDLGNISSGRLGELISFLGCPPVGYEPKLGSLRLSVLSRFWDQEAMPSPKRWLQLASDGGQDGGAGNGAAESLGERAVLEEVIPDAEEHLEEALVAESPNVGMNPNRDMVSNAEAEGRAVSVPPKPGEKRNWDATGGIDREMEVTVLRVLHKHGYQPSSSTSGRMVDQFKSLRPI